MFTTLADCHGKVFDCLVVQLVLHLEDSLVDAGLCGQLVYFYQDFSSRDYHH